LTVGAALASKAPDIETTTNPPTRATAVIAPMDATVVLSGVRLDLSMGDSLDITWLPISTVGRLKSSNNHRSL
jgi:hypothetical protein